MSIMLLSPFNITISLFDCALNFLELMLQVMAVHSQSMVVPECPVGWKDMWIGYSFAMVSSFISEFEKQNIIEHYLLKSFCLIWALLNQNADEKFCIHKYLSLVCHAFKQWRGP
jgi:C-terminal tandem repeated domain in type 4 procollagen